MTDKELIAEAEKAYEDVFNVARRERDLIRRLAEIAELHALCDDRLWGVEKHAERMEAERDAAVAAIERVRVRHEKEPVNTNYGGTRDICLDCEQSWPCPTIRALDGAPEPEWEWGYRGETLIDVHPRKSRESAEGAVKDLTEYWAAQGKKFEVVRRRKAGPWLPVEGDGE